MRESGHILEGLNMQVRVLSRQLESCQVEGKEGGISDSKVTVEMLSKQVQDIQGGD